MRQAWTWLAVLVLCVAGVNCSSPELEVAVEVPVVDPVEIPAEVPVEAADEVEVEELRSPKPLSDEQASREDERKWQDGYWPFSAALYRSLAAQEPGNLFFSPYSINVLLAMMIDGAEGETRAEIVRALDVDADTDVPAVLRTLQRSRSEEDTDDPVLRVHSSIWAQQGSWISPDYLDGLAENFDAGVQLIDFAQGERAAREINQWTAKATEGAIDKIVEGSDFSRLTRALLLNVTRFEDRWKEPFDEAETKDRPFHRLDGTTVSVPMMHQETELQYWSTDSYEAVIAEYERRGSMVLLLPKPGRFREVDSRLSFELLAAIEESEDYGTYDVELTVPRIRFRSKLDLMEALRGLGIERAFIPTVAEFERIAPGDLYLGKVAQNAELTIDEEGTRATAVTQGKFLDLGGGPEGTKTLTFDRPFLLLIIDEDLTRPLFIGRIVDPSG